MKYKYYKKMMAAAVCGAIIFGNCGVAFAESSADMPAETYAEETGVLPSAAAEEETAVSLPEETEEDFVVPLSEEAELLSEAVPAEDTDERLTSIEIRSQEDFDRFAAEVAAGNTTLNASLKCDVALTAPVGKDGSAVNVYCGTFEGNGYTIEADISDTSGQTGVFAGLGAGAVVKDVAVTGSIKSTSTYVGGIAGIMREATVEGCQVNAVIQSSYKPANPTFAVDVGGIAGSCRGGSIVDCKVTGAVNGRTVIGGIAGEAVSYGTETVIRGCVSEAEVCAVYKTEEGVSISGSPAGGIVGEACSRSDGAVTIISCVNTGDVSAFGTAGGILGRVANASSDSIPVMVQKCQNMGTVANKNSNWGAVEGVTYAEDGQTGGIVGLANKNCQIESCINSGAVSSTGVSAGGICGGTTSTAYIVKIADCYNTATVSGSQYNNYAGGILGILGSANSSALSGKKGLDITLQNCYNTGTVDATLNAGGIIGRYYQSKTRTLAHNYALQGCTESSKLYNCGNSDSGNGSAAPGDAELEALAAGTAFVTDAELSALADIEEGAETSTLGSGYKPYTGHYPLLNWQTGTYQDAVVDISGVDAPVAGMDLDVDGSTSLAGVCVDSIRWLAADAEETSDQAQPDTIYTAVISVSAQEGYILDGNMSARLLVDGAYTTADQTEISYDNDSGILILKYTYPVTGEQTEPDDPADSDDVQNPDDPADSDDVQNPDDPTDSDDVQNPDDPTDPDDIQNPDDPTDPDDVQNPDDPTDPDDVQDPDDTKIPSDSQTPSDTTDPDSSQDPNHGADPVDGAGTSTGGSDGKNAVPSATNAAVATVSPKTGDAAHPGMWTLTLTGCAGFAAITIRSRKDRKTL